MAPCWPTSGAGRIVDVLPDRTSETFAAWLTGHPGAESICRDRASACTRAVRVAAPGCPGSRRSPAPVAEPVLLLGGEDLPPAPRLSGQTCTGEDGDRRAGIAPDAVTARGTASHPDHRRARYRYEDMHRLLERRWTISAIVRRLNLDRKTVRRFRDTYLDELLASACERRPNGVMDPSKAYVSARFAEAQGQVSGTRLFLEIRARGYRGSRQVVRKHLAALRAGTTEPVRADIPSPRKITSWVMRPREALTESQEERLLQVRLACPGIARACDLARVFADLVRHRRGYLLLERIRQAEQDAPTPMTGFAGFLRQDLDVVTAGLTLPWGSGVVEGHVNRVRTPDRAVYGRASSGLLQVRIITQP